MNNSQSFERACGLTHQFPTLHHFYRLSVLLSAPLAFLSFCSPPLFQVLPVSPISYSPPLCFPSLSVLLSAPLAFLSHLVLLLPLPSCYLSLVCCISFYISNPWGRSLYFFISVQFYPFLCLPIVLYFLISLKKNTFQSQVCFSFLFDEMHAISTRSLKLSLPWCYCLSKANNGSDWDHLSKDGAKTLHLHSYTLQLRTFKLGKTLLSGLTIIQSTTKQNENMILLTYSSEIEKKKKKKL